MSNQWQERAEELEAALQVTTDVLRRVTGLHDRSILRERALCDERQHILTCINLYGDEVLHDALDAAGLLMKGRDQEDAGR